MSRPFGIETLEEKDRIRQQLLADGHPGTEPDLFFEVERVFVAAHAADPSMGERQEWHAMRRELLAPRRPRTYLTREELEYLVDRLAMVNDPMGVRTRTVLLAMLGR